jgi:tetratricopeptide (TPR) repeat protein
LTGIKRQMVVICSAAALFVAAGMAVGADFAAEFDQANRLYEQGQFNAAAEAYEKLIAQETANPTLWFNLGNAHFKSGHLGRSIAAYRQAEMLSPRDPDVRFNLRFARKQAMGGDAPARPWLERTLRALTLNEWTALACGPFWLCFGLLAAGQWKTKWKRRANRWAGFLAAAAVLFGAATAGATRLRYVEQEAVVVVSEAAVRNGPLEVSPVRFTARDGTEFKVLDHLNDWRQVEDLSGRIGWVRETEMLLVGAAAWRNSDRHRK